MIERAAYLPGLDQDALEWELLDFATQERSIQVAVPVLSAAEVKVVTDHVRQQSQRTLKTYSTVQIIEVIDAAIARLLDRDDPYRRKMEDLLPVITGYDAEIVRLGLTRYLKTFRKPELLRFLAEDFSNPQILDGFQPLIKGGFGRAYGPDVLAHIWAGNVPGLPLWSLVSGLLVKAGNIGKTSSAEPLFAVWVAQVLAEVDPDLGECLAIMWWRGGTVGPETALLGEADVALGFGSNHTLNQIRLRTPVTTRFLAYGHKVSFSVISAPALDAQKVASTARLAVADIIRYDQQGCYAPQVMFVERNGAVSPELFAQFVARELSVGEHKHPRRKLDIAQQNSISSWIFDEEIVSESCVISDSSGTWAVSFQGEDLTFQPGALNRTIRIIAVDDIAQVPAIIRPFKLLLQTAGLAVPPDALYTLAAALGAAGVTRITALGDMTSPEAGWHHDGRFNLSDLVRITEIEARLPPAADKLAHYAD